MYRFDHGRGRAAAALAAVALAAGAAGVAEAGVPGNGTAINGTTLENDAGWDLSTGAGPFGFNSFGIGDGSFEGSSDAFDGGLALTVAGSPIAPRDGTGSLVGTDGFRVGPVGAGGLQVTDTRVALENTQVLRILVKLQNKGAKAVTRPVAFGSDLGSDSSTVVLSTSSGDAVQTTSDRWVVTADDLTTPSDATVAHVLGGKGETLKRELLAKPGVNGGSTVAIQHRVRVPAKSSRYLLFFSRLDNNADDSVIEMLRFEPRELDGDLLAGISASVRAKVLNWDLD